MTVGAVTRSLLRGAGQRPLVLMYHATPASGRGDRWALPLRHFRSHLDLIQELGWRAVTLKELMEPAVLPPRTVVLTFDDGYADNLRAAELLAERGLRGTWFIVSQALGGRAAWSNQATGALMSGPEVRRLHEAGHEIGSHTRTHVALDTVGERVLRSEVEGSRRDLEDLTGARVTAFAFPYGRWSKAARRAVEAAGYRAAVTCRGGAIQDGADRLLLPRLEIDGACCAERLARILALAAAPGRWGDVLRYSGRRLRDRLLSALAP